MTVARQPTQEGSSLIIDDNGGVSPDKKRLKSTVSLDMECGFPKELLPTIVAYLGDVPTLLAMRATNRHFFALCKLFVGS